MLGIFSPALKKYSSQETNPMRWSTLLHTLLWRKVVTTSRTLKILGTTCKDSFFPLLHVTTLWPPKMIDSFSHGQGAFLNPDSFNNKKGAFGAKVQTACMHEAALTHQCFCHYLSWWCAQKCVPSHGRELLPTMMDTFLQVSPYHEKAYF